MAGTLIRRAVMADTSADTTNNHGDIYIGTPLTLDDNGRVLPHDTDDAETIIVGVCVGVGVVPAGNSANEAGMFNAANLEQQYGKLSDSAALATYVWYAPAEDTIFEIQSAAAMAIAVNAPGNLLDHTGTTDVSAGSRTTGRSSLEATTSSNGNLRVVAHPEYTDNDMTLANARLHVIFAASAYRAVNTAT